MHEAIVVGAGPAGLTAALYLARFRRQVLIVHDDTARARLIPRSHNVPGFPEGISGPDLLERMHRHARHYGAETIVARVASAGHNGGPFRLETADGRRFEARTLLIATGNRMNEAPLPAEAHQAAIDTGTLRYCPVCDGIEHLGERIGVIGCDSNGLGEALFLRTFSDDVTLMPLSSPALTADQKHILAAAGVRLVEAPLSRLEPDGARMHVHLEGAPVPLTFDVVYPALGSQSRTQLASALGLDTGDDGKLSLHSPFGTPVPGLYAAGDVVEGLDQISVAMGHGAVAATRMHNWLREQDGERG